MVDSYTLSKDAKIKIKRNIEEGLIPKKLMPKIITSESNDDLIQALCQMYDLNTEQKKRIWFHIINNVWNKDDISTCFNECECIFFKELINNKGFLKKSDCFKISVLETDFKISRTAKSLSEFGIIDIYVLSSKEVVYILSFSYFNEVFEND
jgi:hypothetical protein